MKRLLVLSAFLFLLLVPLAYAGESVTPPVELADAPIIAVDWSRGASQMVTLHGNRTLSFSNGQKGGKYLLILKQDAIGSRTVTWPSSVHWPGANGPTLSSTANTTDYISFFHNGVSYDMVAVSQGF
jgi:hypothetical protein